MAFSRGQAHYLRVFDTSTTYARWQSYYINQTIAWDSATWSYNPFSVNGLLSVSGSSGSDVSITVPATTLAVDLFRTALDNNRLCEVQVYDFDSSLSQEAPQSSQTRIAIFVGEVIGISGSFTELNVSLGPSLAPVGAQVPPRNYTTSLVGAPLRL